MIGSGNLALTLLALKERLLRLWSARAFGQQDVQPVFHLRLTGVEGENAFIKNHCPLGPVQVFVDQTQLGEGGDVVRIELEGLLEAGLGARQITGLMPKPTVQSIR